MTKEPTNQVKRPRCHYLPQFYLAGFTDSGTQEGQLRGYNLEDKHWFKTKPANVGCRKDYFRVDIPGVDPYFLESKVFSDWESKLSTIFKHISLSAMLPTDNDFIELIGFMGKIFATQPAIRRMLADFKGQSMDRRIAFASAIKEKDAYHSYSKIPYALMEKLIVDPSIDLCQPKHLEAILAVEITKMLHLRHWYLLRVMEGVGELICSNFPISLSYLNNPLETKLDFDQPGVGISFPLTKSMCMIGLIGKEPNSGEMDHGHVALHNFWTYYQSDQIYAASDNISLRARNGEIIAVRYGSGIDLGFLE